MPEEFPPGIGQSITGTLVKSYPTPASDVALSTTLENNVEDYLQSLYGTPPPENTNPGFMLVNEVPIDWTHVKRKYVQDRTNEDTYNASISYEKEDDSAPVFTRDYIVRRANYAVKAKGTTLSGLVNATVTAPGSGYVPVDPAQPYVPVVLSGGTGSGGAVVGIISNGTIQQLVITAEGNYTVAPTLAIGGSGTGATGTVSVQPQSAVLVKEDYIRQPSDELDGLYVLVRRVYMTLPGPTVHSTRIDFDGMVVDIATTAMALPIASSESLTAGNSIWNKTTVKEADSTFWAYQVVESRPVPGNAIPLPTEIRENGDPVTITNQLVVLPITTQESDGGGTWTRQYGKPFDSHLVGILVQESRADTGNVGTSYEDREAGDVVTITSQLVPIGAVVTGEVIDGGGNWVRSFAKQHPDSALVVWQATESRPAIGNNQGWTELTEAGDVLNIAKRLYNLADLNTAESIQGGTIYQRVYGKPYPDSSLVCWLFEEQRPLPGRALTTYERDADGALLTITKILHQLSTITTTDSITSTTWTRITAEPFEESEIVAYQVTRTRAVPGPTLTGYRIDRYTGDLITTTDTIVAAGTSGSAVGSGGGYTVIEVVNDVIAKKHTDIVVGQELVSGRTWTETRLITHLPHVLTTFTPQIFDDSDGNIIRASFYSVLTNYNNYYTVTTNEIWSLTAPTISGPTSIVPQSFSWDTPFGGGQIPECLHGAITISGSIPSGVIPAGYGPSGFRTYGAASWSYAFSATTPAALSGHTIILAQDVRPWPEGGFILHTETITVP